MDFKHVSLTDPKKYQAFADEWRDRLEASEYRWNIPTPSTHELTVHVSQRMAYFPCPLGLTSEENGEKYHKIIRLVHYCYILSRVSNNRTAYIKRT